MSADFGAAKFDFYHAAKVFEADYIEWEDRRTGYGETRFLIVGATWKAARSPSFGPRGER
ncbi:MAG: hypothetical protein ACREM6_03190 [Vulcanimicrobiaceae bacterium]